MEARAAFLAAGGRTLHYLPCLNDAHEWIAALRALAECHLQGWNTRRSPTDPARLALQRERAMQRGASD